MKHLHSGFVRVAAKAVEAGQRLARHPRAFAFLAGLACTLGVLALYVAQPALLQRLDLKTYDLLLPLRKEERRSDALVIIDIDEASLARYGQWPWPRHLLASLLDRLTESGVAAVAFDIMFAEPDRTSPACIRENLERGASFPPQAGSRNSGDATRELSALLASLPDHDALFAAALGRAPAVLGAYAYYTRGGLLAAFSPPGDGDFRVSGQGSDITGQALGATVQGALQKPRAPGLIARGSRDAPPPEQALTDAPDAVLPLPQFVDNAPVGFVNVSPDADGTVRRLPLLVRFGDSIYPSLAAAALMRAQDVDSLRLDSGPDGLERLTIGELSVPVSPQGFMHVVFQGGRGTCPYVSAARVLEGHITGEALEGRIAFVGTSAPGLLDIRATPYDRIMPGVEVHAQAIEAILHGNFVRHPPWMPGAHALVILLVGMASTAAFGFSRARVYAPLSLVLAALAVGTSAALFLHGLFFSPLYALLCMLLCGGALLSVRFWQEERQKSVLRQAFSRYVSPEVVRRITEHQGDLLAGEERELSILFTDLRGFTSLSESLPPQHVVRLLNEYFSPMTAIVRERQGTLDKFIGDALMAFWNAPLDVPGHPALAVDAALSMQEKLVNLNARMEEHFGVRLHMGAGIHTGPAYVGNMGSDDLVNYTLIGDSVNLAARLESLCKRYGAPALVSGDTALRCGQDFVFVLLDELRVKGKALPVRVFWPLRSENQGPWGIAAEEWEVARGRYAQGDFAQAAPAFADLARRHPGLETLFSLYRERCRSLCARPPGNWDGIWIMDEK